MRVVEKILGLAVVKGRINLENSQKFVENGTKKIKAKLKKTRKLLEIRSFHNIFRDFTKWITSFQNFSQKTSLNFYKNRNINRKLTSGVHAKAEKMIAGSFWVCVVWLFHGLIFKGLSTAFK